MEAGLRQAHSGQGLRKQSCLHPTRHESHDTHAMIRLISQWVMSVVRLQSLPFPWHVPINLAGLVKSSGRPTCSESSAMPLELIVKTVMNSIELIEWATHA